MSKGIRAVIIYVHLCYTESVSLLVFAFSHVILHHLETKAGERETMKLLQSEMEIFGAWGSIFFHPYIDTVARFIPGHPLFSLPWSWIQQQAECLA